MTLTTVRRACAIGASALTATGVLAVGASTNAFAGTAARAAASLPSATLNGSGSTFQLAYDQGAIAKFKSSNSAVTINYNGTGSGQGQQDLASKLVDFAGSDVAIPTASMSTYTGGVLYFPTVAAPITLSYNLPGVSHLTLNAKAIAQIFSGKITTWNSPVIAALNHGVKLPSTAITSMHRSDSSGTTSNFTKYLATADPTDWTLGTGKTVLWPGGQAGKGNSGVATLVKQTTGGIGYVDYSDAVASNLKFASIVNKAGKIVSPSLASASAAIAGAVVAPNLVYNPINAGGAKSYPITSPTFVIVYKTQASHAKGLALKAFLRYLLTTGQGSLASQADFAPLSKHLDSVALAEINKIVVPA